MPINGALCPDEPQRFDIGRQCIADAGIDRVETFGGEFNGLIADRINYKSVIAQAAKHSVGTDTTIQQVIASAGEQIVVAAQAAQPIVTI